MSNKIIYPVLIIIFSILVILAILQNKNNKKLNNGIEKFMNNYLSNQENNLKLNIQNNLAATKEFANGSWTFFSTTVDSNYNASGLITININNIPDMITSNNYGNIIFGQTTFIITYVTNEIIIANYEQVTLNIKFLNIFSDENKSNINSIYQNPNTPTAIMSIFIGDNFILKLASYKVYNNKVSGEVYRIIKSGNFFIDSPPPYYDFKSYNKIINDYQFPNNLITINFGTSNDTIKNTIISSYGSKIKFIVRRVFYSPSNDGKEIITKNSNPVLLNVISGNNIPTSIVISPFSNDKDKNNLNTFFKPKATILYFYKLTNLSSTYDYSDAIPVTVPNSVLNLQNNANNVFPQSIQFNNLTSVERNNTSTYTLTYVTTVNSNLNDPTIIPFDTLYQLL